MSLPYRLRLLSGLIAALFLTMGLALPASAAHHRRHAAVAAATTPAVHGLAHHGRRGLIQMLASPTDPEKDAALIVDGATGKVLYARNETAERHPASLTKMMTLYLLFDALKSGKVTMQTPMPVSWHASVQHPTKLNLRPGQTIDVDTAIRAIVIRSANDVAVVIAEALGGTESHFAEMMTERARQLGMKETNYHNASGLPDPLQITTASDLAVLAHHLAYDYPQYFSYFGLSGFNYKGTWYPTHDNLIGRYEGADGIKTGYTGASGFNLVSSVTRGTTHVIGVVMGGRTAVRRDLEMVRLLDQTFAQIGANPALVASRTVPWQQVAQSAPPPVSAGFSLPQVGPGQFAALSPVPQTVQSDDEDAAENVRAPDENFSLIHAEGTPAASPARAAAPQSRPESKPQPAVPPMVAKTAPSMPTVVARAAPAPAIRPSVRPDGALATEQAQLVRTAVNAPRPQMRPALREDAGEGDADASPVPTPGHNWTIQIGAYADKAMADAQLKTYYGKAQDVLASASRIIAPITSPQGHVLYRARFGLFAEREARDVCSRLTQRGQTCFAAVQTR
ncbi:MAG TPA: serine hydrolase [Rhizomicrobium sp.]|nr:serine hydrolase [Rhizomicrobium sp.]